MLQLSSPPAIRSRVANLRKACGGIGCLGVALIVSLVAPAGMASLAARAADTPVAHDGSRDFDFNLGTWKTHVSRLVHPLSGSSEWTQYDGVSIVRPVWRGRASLFELEVDGPAGHIEGVGLRLYDAKSRQWSLNWANGSDPKLDAPMIGEFADGRGDFYGEDTLHDRTILVRNSFLKIKPDSARFEQAFSGDYGKTWETNWIMTFDRSASPGN